MDFFKPNLPVPFSALYWFLTTAPDHRISQVVSPNRIAREAPHSLSNGCSFRSEAIGKLSRTTSGYDIL
jgi:hypothetical protein